MAPKLPSWEETESLFSEKTNPRKLGNRTQRRVWEGSPLQKTRLGESFKLGVPSLLLSASSQNAGSHTYTHWRNWLALGKRLKKLSSAQYQVKPQPPYTSWAARARLGAVSPGCNKGLPVENLKPVIKSHKSWLALYYLFLCTIMQEL